MMFTTIYTCAAQTGRQNIAEERKTEPNGENISVTDENCVYDKYDKWQKVNREKEQERKEMHDGGKVEYHSGKKKTKKQTQTNEIKNE